MNKEALIIFARVPELGRVKTRLAATLGDENALTAYIELLRLNCDLGSNLAQDKFIFWDRSPQLIWEEQFNMFQHSVQKGSDLGEKMINAFRELFSEGYQRIVLIGTDCPYLRLSDLNNAFKQLLQKEVVIGPAEDGGYYLIGINQPQESLFKNIDWSTSAVFNQTLAGAKSAGLSTAFLPTYSDIDNETDYKKWQDSFPSY